MVKIYHNNRCMKSRQTLDILNDKTKDVEIIDYQANPPSKDELKNILKMLDAEPMDIIRKGESIFKENFKGKELSDDEWIDAMIEFPKLIERPIVVNGDKAVIGRPPENVLNIL
ncbi:MAG: arsenate reductase (glutaredoxin) [Ekhidna sp.]